MFIKKSVGKKTINFQQTRVFRIIFKLARKSIFEKIYTFCVFLQEILKVKRRKSNLILFCFYNYVTFIKSYPINSSIGNFQSDCRKPSYQCHFNIQLKDGKWKKCVKLVIKICETIFGVNKLSSVQKSSYVIFKSYSR